MNNLKKKSLIERFTEKIFKSRVVRTAVSKRSHMWFFNIYFNDYVEFDSAPFHYEMFQLTEQDDWKLLCFMAFRNSAKSTILNTSYSLWSILGVQQKKYVLILCQTQAQARRCMMNIRNALERDSLLKTDLGPFKADSSEWGASSIVFSKHNARITVASSEQSIRGTRHNQHRPDLIILDDVEDGNSVKTMEGRKKVYNWFKSEIVPAGNKDTRIIIIGNLLHRDCLVMRIQKEIEEDVLDGIWKTYPLVNDNKEIAWPGMFPTIEEVEKHRKKIGNEVMWQREFLLNIIPDDDQIIQREWFQPYERMPGFDSLDYVGTFISIDPAISEKDTASNTAMVVGSVFGDGDKRKIYIHPNPVNKHLTFFKTKEMAKLLARTVGKGNLVKILVEDVGYQKSLIQDLIREGMLVEAIPVYGLDKQARLTAAAGPIQEGQVFLPVGEKAGIKELIEQTVNFGVEKRTDLVDATSMLIRYAVEVKIPCMPEVFLVGGND